MADAGRPAVYTIDAGRPFVDDLARTVLDETADDPARLADWRILLPTRRAQRALQEAFLRQAGGRALLLPAITPLGDIDEDEVFLAGDEDGDGAALDLPPAISGLRRQMLLARQILAMPDRAQGPDQAAGLALELARLLDQLATERKSVDDLEALALDESLRGASARHWQDTLVFLDILKTTWPAILAERGALDPAARRNAVIDSQAERWRNHPPETPVVAAGSTGSIAATADLLAVIAHLPQGRVVLPGLDRGLDQTAWEALATSHPQYGLKRLLDRLETAREDVRPWPGAEAGPIETARARLVSEALKPAETMATPPDRSALPAAAFDGFERIDCGGPEAEADVIAVVLREALETPGRTAALVTPDRALAERVAGQLLRWGIRIDDSAGRPLGQTPPAAFLRLIAATAADGFGPVALLSALKHPLCALGQTPADLRRATRVLERACLRGVRPAPGLAGLRAAWTAKRKHPDAAVDALLDGLQAAFEPLLAALGGDDLAAVVQAHARTAEACAASDTETGAARLWRGDAGEATATFLNEFADAAPDMNGTGAAAPAAYVRLFDRLMAPRAVRPRWGRHPRLFIWGLLEARLQSADVMVLGGLNEGVWPTEPNAGPWLSRPMTAALGLAPPERRLGLTAHDFVQAVCHGRVVVTRAAREQGAETVPARWLQRIETLVRGTGLEPGFRPKTAYTAWAQALDAPGPPRRAEPPRPMPAPALRPSGLSVTQIETWFRDPYAIFAREILGLRVIDPVEMPPGPRERGNLIHDVLERFAKAHPDNLPGDAERRMIEIGRDVFQPMMGEPGVKAFWWPRFERLARWFVAEEAVRRARGQRPVVIEEKRTVDLAVGDTTFRLTGKVDRIDALGAGGYAVIDYKTGQPPSDRMVLAHVSPQLSLEAHMVAAGAFESLPAGARVDALVYVQATGGSKPGLWREVKPKDTDVPTLAAEAAAGLQKLALKFQDPATPYLSRPRVQFLAKYGDYDHLARVREWAVAGGDDA